MLEETVKAIDEIKLYMQCRAAYYDKCAKDNSHEPDAIRAHICRIILEDLNQKGRIALTIDRLREFLPICSQEQSHKHANCTE